jgi:hypothetical protein
MILFLILNISGTPSTDKRLGNKVPKALTKLYMNNPIQPASGSVSQHYGKPQRARNTHCGYLMGYMFMCTSP